MTRIQLLDTTLRDGEQSPGVNLNQAEKIQIALQLEQLGIDVMEVGFPAASEGDFRAVQQVASVIKSASVMGMARTTEKDIRMAYEALKDAVAPRIHVFLATSDIHMKYKLRMSRREVLDTVKEMMILSSSLFPSVEFCAEDASRTDLDFLSEVAETAIKYGATLINVPDTVGYSTPLEYGNIFRHLRENVPSAHKAIFSSHCHNDLGMAVANSLAALQNGAMQVEGTINGIGERAGNASLEEIAVALHTRKNYYNFETGVVFKEIAKTSSLVSRLTGMVVPKNKAIVGANAFAHESGIHQDGILKESTTYEIISPSLVGFEKNKLVLGKHSGRHAFIDRMIELGYNLAEEEQIRAFRLFKQLTDRKKEEITEDDLHALIAGEKATYNQPYEIDHVQVNFVLNGIQSASVRIKDSEGNVHSDAATGAGSIEAIYNAIQRILIIEYKLVDYRIQSINQGQDALVDVHVELEHNNRLVTGYGVAQDLLEASARAYVHAAGKLSTEVISVR